MRVRSARWGLAVASVVIVIVTACAPPMPAPPPNGFTTITYNRSSSAPSIGLIGDSSFAGVRWLHSYEPLKKFNFVLDAESCRRTINDSCRGREGYRPHNAIWTLRRLNGTFDDVLVMVTGYNDPGSNFATAVDTIMSEAINQGIGHVVWLTMRTADVSYVSPGFRSNSYTFRDNNKILLQKAQRYGGRLQIADWATYSANQKTWVTPDGVHLTRAGTTAVTGFIADQVTKVVAGQTITPRQGTVPSCRVSIPLREGDRINSVRCLEQHLHARGFDVTVDDTFDRKTTIAVNFVNYARSWGRDGLADHHVLTAIGAYRPPPGNPRFCLTFALLAGTRHTNVTCLQSALAALGYQTSPPYDLYSAELRSAVTHFQRHRGLSVTGHAEWSTMKALSIWRSSRCTISRQLQQYDVHTEVQCLRTRLNGIGYRLPESRHFTKGVADAVRTIERRAGLPADGVADQRFLQVLGAWRPPPPPPPTTTTTTTTTTAPSTTTTTTTAPSTTMPLATSTSGPTSSTVAPAVSTSAPVESSTTATSSTMPAQELAGP
jgi:peptidoglycan hydrolase-like protein with peptidoglycan-binding domain